MSNWRIFYTVRSNCGLFDMRKRKALIIILLVLLLCVSVLAGILLGSVSISVRDILACLTGRDTDSKNYILITAVRIPRVFGGLVAGLGLATAGVILQGVMNNALASPNTIGVNSGAGFAVMLSMAFWPGNLTATASMAFLGALITTLLIFLLAYFSDSSRTTIILAGVTVSSFLSAGINTIKLMDTDITVNMTSFMIGSLSGITFKKLILPGYAVIIGVFLACMLAKALNILGLGDDIARSLGLRVNLMRFVLLVIASVLAGVVVSYAGLLSFVGLIVPHICRRIFGNDNRLLLPCSALLGGSFVLISDMIGRTLFAPYELPVGIIMSFLGGPFFLYLLRRRNGGRRVNA
ncbi:MAG: iron ABC transporter permease [Lacrimispora sp.]